VGPAAAPALARPGAALRVHSVFSSTLNLQVQGYDLLVALTGFRGAVHPHAVALAGPEPCTGCGLAPGDPGRVGAGVLWIRGRDRVLAVDLAGARRPPRRSLPAPARPGAAHRACRLRLAAIQADRKLDLRLEAPAETPLGGSLRAAARALGVAARAWAGVQADLDRTVAGLVGLGPGLTPAGDDFMCGFMAAARACEAGARPARPGLRTALDRAVLARLGATGDISASLLRAAARGLWPEPLADLAAALAGDRVSSGLRALDDLCEFGRSSGADLATGFLLGLEALARGA
jgi:hypothetical protein